jgi:hypothetical protein
MQNLSRSGSMPLEMIVEESSGPEIRSKELAIFDAINA